MTLDNKEGFHINKAIIKMRLPDDWDFSPNINSSEIDYYPTSSRYEIRNFSETNVAEWFEIKPGPKVSPGTYSIGAEAEINFTVYGSTREVTQNDSVKLVVATTTNWTEFITSNYPALIAAMCALITVLFGPNIYDRIKKRREERQNDNQEEAKKKGWWQFWK